MRSDPGSAHQRQHRLRRGRAARLQADAPFFASIDFDIIPKVLTITGGVRFYHYDEFEHGSEYYSESTSGSFSRSGQGLVVNHLNGACTAAGLCGFPINLDKSESGHRWRGNLTWHVTQDVMAYYTYSEGFRPGGFNRHPSTDRVRRLRARRARDVPLTDRDPRCRTGGTWRTQHQQFNKPAGFESDQLINHEIGIKSEWLDHRLLVNVSGYVMNWSNVQLPLFDPVHLGNTTFDVNGPTYKVKGFEVQFVARLFGGPVDRGLELRATAPSRPMRPVCRATPGVSAATRRPLGQCITVGQGAAVHESRTACSARGRPSRRRGCSTCGRATTGRSATTSRSPGSAPATSDRRATSRRASRAAPMPAQTVADHDAAALRHPELHHLRRGDRRRQGQLDGADHRQQPDQRVRTDQHLLRSVHPVGDSAAAAGHHVPVRVQVLSRALARPTACGRLS